MVQELRAQSARVVPLRATPPVSVEIEEAILGAILFDPNAIARVIDRLPMEAFYSGSHREIYRAACALHLDGLPTDLMSVSQRLADLGGLEKAGGRGKLADLFESTVSAINIDHYADVITSYYKRRQLFAVGQELCQSAYDTSEDLQEVIDGAEQRLFSVTQATHKTGLVDLSEGLISSYEEIERRSQGEIPPGLACGFYDLDAMTQGFQRQDLIIVAGRPSMGKTAFVINVARSMATFLNVPIAFFSLEMSREKLTRRLLSMEARIESGRLKAGRIQGNEWVTLGSAIGQLSQASISIDDTNEITVSEMRSKCRKLAAEKGQLGAVMVDYLQLMGTSGDNRAQELSAITRQLKGLARELNCPVFALSQLNRSVEGRSEKRPMMSDLKESGGIEQDADLILMLFRDEYYNADTPDRGIAEVIISKHRDGPTGTVKLLFEPQFNTFKNLANPNRG